MGDPRQGFHLLMLGELRLAAELHSPSFSPDATFIGPTKYEMALELCQSAQDRDHQLAVGRSRVRPGITEGPEARPVVRDQCEDVQ